MAKLMTSNVSSRSTRRNAGRATPPRISRSKSPTGSANARSAPPCATSSRRMQASITRAGSRWRTARSARPNQQIARGQAKGPAATARFNSPGLHHGLRNGSMVIDRPADGLPEENKMPTRMSECGDRELDRRDVLQTFLGAALASLPGFAPRVARAQAALQPIRMGIQIFTGAVATVWVEKKIYEKRGLSVDGKQLADGRSVRDAMVAGELNAGTMNITPFIVGATVSSLTMVGVVSLGGDTVGVVARKGAGMNGIADLKGRRVGISVGSTTGNIF